MFRHNSIVKLVGPVGYHSLRRLLFILFVAMAVSCLTVGLYYSLVISHADYLQGQSVRIMFVHVPTAWIAMLSYSTMTVAAVVYLIWRAPLADLISAAVCPVAALFAALALVTGSIWGKPIWGAWWVNDPRLLSTLVLFIICIGLIALRSTIEHHGRAAIVTSVLIVAGALDIPIVIYSVEWWNSLHQPSSGSMFSSRSIDPSFRLPLQLMFAGLVGVAGCFVLLLAESRRRERRLARLVRNLG